MTIKKEHKPYIVCTGFVILLAILGYLQYGWVGATLLPLTASVSFSILVLVVKWMDD